MSVTKGRNREEKIQSWSQTPSANLATCSCVKTCCQVNLLPIFSSWFPFFGLESSSVCCSQLLSTLLSQSAPPTSFPPLLFTHSTFFLLQPSWVPVSRLLAFYPHSLHPPHLPSLSTNAGWPFFTPTISSTLYPTSALFSQANHAEMQCNCANVSYPSFGSLHPLAALFECKQRRTTPL